MQPTQFKWQMDVCHCALVANQIFIEISSTLRCDKMQWKETENAIAIYFTSTMVNGVVKDPKN